MKFYVIYKLQRQNALSLFVIHLLALVPRETYVLH